MIEDNEKIPKMSLINILILIKSSRRHKFTKRSIRNRILERTLAMVGNFSP